MSAQSIKLQLWSDVFRSVLAHDAETQTTWEEDVDHAAEIADYSIRKVCQSEALHSHE